jgi:hypothetical protein
LDDKDDNDPDWVHPGQDRRTPYTDDELDRLVADFIRGLDDQEWQAIKDKYGGEERCIEKIRAGFVKRDQNNLLNMPVDGPLH